MKEYNKANISLAKTLRKNMTPWERKLWYEFLRYYPLRFQRQKAIGNYIVDFYCAKMGLVIELDGGRHYTPEQAEKDNLRTQDLERMKLTVIRICNVDIDRDFRGVCEYIDKTAKDLSLSQPVRLTAPLTRGAFRTLHASATEFSSIQQVCTAPMAPSDEGAVTKGDWGRENLPLSTCSTLGYYPSVSLFG